MNNIGDFVCSADDDGDKSALVIGLDYPGKEYSLKGCVDDAERFMECLVNRYRFRRENITILSHKTSPKKYITDEVILKALGNMIKSAKKGDTLVVFFAGHGGVDKKQSYLYANNSGFTEYLVAESHTYITDSMLRQYVEAVPKECSFTFIADCCRSGALIEGAQEIIGYSTINPIEGKVLWKPKIDLGLGRPSGRPLGVLISACQNYESIKERYLGNGKYGSYFTEALLKVIETYKGNITNRILVEEIRRILHSKKQFVHPGLYCSVDQADMPFLGATSA